MTATLDFMTAVDVMKSGGKVRRLGWPEEMKHAFIDMTEANRAAS